SPIFFQNIMVSVQGLIFKKERYNDEYFKEMTRLKSVDDEFKLQQERLNKFVSYIRKNSKFYNELLSDLPDLVNIEDLKKLPTTDKETIRTNLEDIVTRKNNLIKMGTGGSTGKSLTYYTHPKDISRKIAYLDYYKEKHGV